MAWSTSCVTVSLFFLLFITNYGISDGKRNCEGRGSKGAAKIGVARDFYNCYMKTMSGGISDLIFLIDASGSMRSRNWYTGRYVDGWAAALKFVKSLLTEVRISFNSTRVSVATYSTKVTKQINYIWDPVIENHKCKFNREFQNIPFDGQMTNIKGAFDTAYDIFYQQRANQVRHKYRKNANKVVILISDGYGNRHSKADQLKAARVLKDNIWAEVYTVGLSSGSDTAFLKQAATDEDLFFTTSFSDLSKIATYIRGGKIIYVGLFKCMNPNSLEL